MASDPRMFGAVVEVSQAVTATNSRKAKVAALADLLRHSPREGVDRVAAYLSGTVPQGRLGIGWRSVADPPSPAGEPSLTLDHVDRIFTALAATSGQGSAAQRRKLLAELLGRATAAEQAFLRNLMLGELRQGASEAVVAQAIAVAAGVPEVAVRRAAMLAGSVVAVARPALEGGEAALDRIRLRVGAPVLPMLAGSAPDVAAAFGDQGGVRLIERKIDGIRVQIHVDNDHSGPAVRVFTRNLEEITDRVPDVVHSLAGLSCAKAVLDGEAIALDAYGRPEPFQVTGARTAIRVDAVEFARRTPLTVWLFDVLHLDGTDLLGLPLRQRRERLAALLGPAYAGLRVPGLITDDVGEAEAWFRDTVAAGHEGVMVKALEAPYAAGRRGSGWTKVKPRHTVDLVVLGVERGSGRRSGWLSNIHLGARDPMTGELVMVGKTFKGMTDAMLRWQTQRFTELALPAASNRTDSGPARESDVADPEWLVRVRPEQVVEIAFDGVQRSRRYSGGVALRFARVLRYRDDKTVDQIDTLITLRELAGTTRD